MTTVRFVGDLSLWLGLALALIVCVMSWRYYIRESFDLPGRLRWFLPLLRSLAFLLGVMVLTGPVLHHRKTIGELGRVKIYLDVSRSMTMHDRHMSTGRKLMIAEQLGWISAGHVDSKLLKLADELAEARREFAEQIEFKGPFPGDSPDEKNGAANDNGPLNDNGPAAIDIEVLRKAKATFQSRLVVFQPLLPATLTERFSAELLQPLDTAGAGTDIDAAAMHSQLVSVADACESMESSIHVAFDEAIDDIVRLGDESLQTALAMFDETPRWRRAELGLSESSADLLAKLREKHDVEVLTLSGEEATLQNSWGRMDSDFREDGTPHDELDALANDDHSTITDLSTGVIATQKSASRASQSDAESGSDAVPTSGAAIVLLTDGQHNSGPSPLQTARVLGAQGIKFYSVSLGASQQAADLAVIGLEHPDLVFQKDSVRGVLILGDRMSAGKSFVTQISYGDETLWQKQLVSQNSGERRIEFEFRIEELVTRLGAQFAADLRQHTLPLEFNVSVSPLAEESETENNERSMRLAAIVQSNKILIMDGRSRWETRYLRNVFERDSQWSVNTIIAGAGTDEPVLRRGDQEGAFPASRDGLFEYDLVIFGEVSPDLFSDSDLDWLREFVEIRGGGLIFIDGQRGAIRQLAQRSIGSLLPVEWQNEPVTSKPVSLKLTDRGATESSLRLASEDLQNRRFWTELPAPHSLVAVNALPGAEVLAEVTVADRQYPGMVTRAFGAGRVLYMAFDETWRWRYKVADTWHQRIWNQLAKFVMPRPFAVSDDFVSIDTGPVRYDAGDPVSVRVRLLGLDGRPALNASADALIRKDGRLVSTVSLDADADVPGIYRGRFDSLPAGEYEVSVRAAGYSDSALKARSRFVVLPSETGEMTQTDANETLLKQIASASGGACLREEEMARLSDLLAPLSSGRVVESDTLIWQSYWWFAAIVMLLTLEWVLRKRAGLL